MAFVPDADAVAAKQPTCLADTKYYFDTYREVRSAWKDMDGNPITATGTVDSPGEDTVYYFISTDPSQVGSKADSGQTVTLETPLVVPGATTMQIQLKDSVTTNAGHCWLDKMNLKFLRS